MTFKSFTQTLLSNPSKVKLIINGKEKSIRAFAKLTSKNYLQGEYWKIRFTDDSFLLIIMQDMEMYYSDLYTLHIKSIKDDQIGRDKKLEIDGKIYELGNRDDYQFLKELVYGSPLDIEGECRFSDYFPVKGTKEFLSLGWLMKNGERADIHCSKIDLNKIVLQK